MSTCTLERVVAGAVPVQPAAMAELASLVALSRLPVAPLPRQAPDASVALLEAELRVAVAEAATDRAYDAAVALWRRTGDLARCDAVIDRALERQGEHRASVTAARVRARLRVAARTRPPVEVGAQLERDAALVEAPEDVAALLGAGQGAPV